MQACGSGPRLETLKAMKVTILGAGNIGGAMARGLVAGGAVNPLDLTLTALHEKSLSKYGNLGCRLTTDNVRAVADADIIVIAVKPWAVVPLVREIRDSIDYKSQTIVCMAAGMDTGTLLPEFGSDSLEFLYVIPNTAMEVCESMTFITPVCVSDGNLDKVQSLFDCLGSTAIVDEAHLSAGTALASCGIAYAMRYARAATLGGVELGVKPAEALRIVEQTVIGAMKLMQEHGSHPESEIDKVTTPGGITIKGLNAMEKYGFTTAVIEGLKASKK